MSLSLDSCHPVGPVSRDTPLSPRESDSPAAERQGGPGPPNPRTGMLGAPAWDASCTRLNSSSWVSLRALQQGLCVEHPPGLQQGRELSQHSSTLREAQGMAPGEVPAQPLCQLLHSTLDHDEGLSQATDHPADPGHSRHQVGRCAPSQAIKEEALGSQKMQCSLGG